MTTAKANNIFDTAFICLGTSVRSALAEFDAYIFNRISIPVIAPKNTTTSPTADHPLP